MRSKALPRAEELKVKLKEKYARDYEEKHVMTWSALGILFTQSTCREQTKSMRTISNCPLGYWEEYRLSKALFRDPDSLLCRSLFG